MIVWESYYNVFSLFISTKNLPKCLFKLKPILKVSPVQLIKRLLWGQIYWSTGNF